MTAIIDQPLRRSSNFDHRSFSSYSLPMMSKGTMMPNNKILRWGIVGCGRIASDFVKAMRFCAVPSLNQIGAVATSGSEHRAKQFCAENGLADGGTTNVRCYGTHEALYADKDIDVVYIATLNHQHLNDVLNALNAGKHVLCEKPMGINAREVREMVQRARDRGRFLMEGYWSRCFPLWCQIKNKQLKELGNLDMVQSDFGFTNKRVMSAPDEVINGGEGYLLSTGCYSVMAAQFVFDDQEPVEVVANGARKNQMAKGWDTWADILLRYPGGGLARLFYSGEHRTVGAMSIYGTQGNIRIPSFFWSPVEAVVEQYGPESARRANASAHKVLRQPLPDPAPAQFNYPNTVGLCYQIDHVRGCIMAGKTESPLMSLEHSVRLATILDQIRHQLGVKYPQDDQQ